MVSTFRTVETYKYGQIIINTFEDDCLVEKQGYFFDVITHSDNKFQLIKNGQIIFSLDITAYSLEKLEGFNHYFAFSKQSQRVEIYFP